MSVRRSASRNHSVSIELGIVVTVLIGVFCWQRLMRAITDPVSTALGADSTVGAIPVGGLATGGLFVVGLASFAGIYAISRGINASVELPAHDDLGLVGLAVVVPAALVAATKAVGVLTGTTYQSVVLKSYGSDGLTMPVVATLGLELLVLVPTLVIVAHVLVQGSLGRILGSDSAIVVTTLVTGFLMRDHTGSLATSLDSGKLVGVIALVLTLGIALYATEHVERDQLRYPAYVPALMFVAVAVLSGVAAIESVAGGLLAVTQLAVLGIAAYTYERSGSLLVPALAYLSLLLATDVVVVAVETGI